MYAVYNIETFEVYGEFDTFEEAEAFEATISYEDASEASRTRISTTEKMLELFYEEAF